MGHGSTEAAIIADMVSLAIHGEGGCEGRKMQERGEGRKRVIAIYVGGQRGKKIKETTDMIGKQ
jgi:hypothetical protein